MEHTALSKHTPHTRPAPLPGGLLQRACACGQHAPGGGECAGCRKKRLAAAPGGLQRAVGPHPEGPHPREATLPRSPNPLAGEGKTILSPSAAPANGNGRLSPLLFAALANGRGRLALGGEGPHATGPHLREATLPRSPNPLAEEGKSGRALHAAARAFMEPRFGHDSSHFSIHSPVSGHFQAKLAINLPGDEYEQEADQIANRVLAGPAQAGTIRVSRHIQRFWDNSPAPAEAAPAIVGQVLASPGRPLDASARSFFEPRFGAGFDQVRVHTGSTAAESARAVNALAYTVGREVVFGKGQYSPGTSEGKRLLAHELVHVVQQGGASPAVLQRAGDPAAIPTGFPCPTDLTPGTPAGPDLLFPGEGSAITPAHTTQLTTFQAAWLAAGGTDDILVHGYASTDGDQGLNWTLSCNRAQAVRAELIRLGIPAVRIEIVAHGESTDFGPGAAANRHAVVSSSPGGILPLAFGNLTPRDNFTGRSVTRFGVGEIIDLSFFSFPPRPPADFGGLEWHIASGGGALAGVTPAGTATYTAPPTADTVRLELRVAAGATAGRVISAHTITIVIPSAVNMVAVAGSAPNFGGWGNPPIPAGTWGAGFQANVFVDPKDVSFQGVVFGEATVAAVVTPAGSFLSTFGAHPANTFGPGHAGNATTGTAVSPPQDGAWFWRGPARTVLGVPICGNSDFLWAIPWEFSVSGGPRTRFAGGFTANQHATSSTFCDATIEKAGAGPFCRRINGTTC